MRKPKDNREKKKPVEQKPKVEKKEASGDWLDNVEVDQIRSKPVEKPNEIKTVEKEQVVQATEVSQSEQAILESRFRENLPGWISKPFMYVQPGHEKLLNSWLDSWENLIVEFARTFRTHVININELRQRYPFENTNNSKQLTKKQLEYIFSDMENKGMAKWLDDNLILVRVYYKPLGQWKEIILKFLFDTGRAAEVLTIFEFQNMGEEWSSLPRDDLIEIIETLVDEGHARWIGNKEAVTFNI